MSLSSIAFDTSAAELEPLTLEILQQRTSHPIQKNGNFVIDLSQLDIDISEGNLELKEQFEQQIQNQINRSKVPLGIDLSESTITGDFEAAKLGIKTVLAPGYLSSLLTPEEQETITSYSRIASVEYDNATYFTVFKGLLDLNNAQFHDRVLFNNTVFLHSLEAKNTKFYGAVEWNNSLFGKSIDWSNAVFDQTINFSRNSFFAPANWQQVQFNHNSNFSNSIFVEPIKFNQSSFKKLADFNRIECQQQAEFEQITWRDRPLFSSSRFLDRVSFADDTFIGVASFRQARFNQEIDFSNVSLLNQLDFSGAVFAPKSRLNVQGLALDSQTAKIIGEAGKIGRVIDVPTLVGNEAVLKNLVRNFRQLEQVSDANQIEYLQQKLRLKYWSSLIVGIPKNKVLSFEYGTKIIQWACLCLLLLLSDYGTNFSLVFGIGLVSIAVFSSLFWTIDRWRLNQDLPKTYEIISIAISFSIVGGCGITNIYGTGDHTLWTLACLSILLIPFPIGLTIVYYQQGWNQNDDEEENISYFVEDGSMRQFRFLLGRLPIMPRFPFFRDRYQPVLVDRRWSWLNYYDFSLINLFKFGFNDIRLRDRRLPGIVSTLVWYQWSLGILYFVLLLWTLSRTIPGLNLLIYF